MTPAKQHFIRVAMHSARNDSADATIARARATAQNLRHAANEEAGVLRSGLRGGWTHDELCASMSRVRGLLLRASRCRSIAIILKEQA